MPISHVPAEVICEWNDWVNEQRRPTFTEPVFTVEEQAAIDHFHTGWDKVADETQDSLHELEVLHEAGVLAAAPRRRLVGITSLRTARSFSECFEQF